MTYRYHSYEDLLGLGLRVRDKAISVTLDSYMAWEDSYGEAQQAANADAYRVRTGTPPHVPGYNPPASGRPDDADSLRDYLFQYYSDIPEAFGKFALPNDPDNYKKLIDHISHVVVSLCPNVDTRQFPPGEAPISVPGSIIDGSHPINTIVDIIGTRMKNWSGDAAITFENYIGGINDVSEIQASYMADMSVLLASYLEVQRRKLTDIWEIGNKTLDVLDAAGGDLRRKGWGGGTSNGWRRNRRRSVQPSRRCWCYRGKNCGFRRQNPQVTSSEHAADRDWRRHGDEDSRLHETSNAQPQ